MSYRSGFYGWIGLHDDGSGREWDGGIPVNYTMFSLDDGSPCTKMGKFTGGWYAVPCAGPNVPLCQIYYGRLFLTCAFIVCFQLLYVDC